MAGSEQESKMNTKKNGSSEGESFPVQKDAKAEGSAEENASASKLEIAEEAGFVARKSSSPERKSNHDAEIESLRERVVTLERKIRELEEVKTCLATQLQVEENKVESNRKDRAATEKLLQETREKHQTQLAAQKEYYTHALAESKEAEASAELRAKHKASSEYDRDWRKVEEDFCRHYWKMQELIHNMGLKRLEASAREHVLRRNKEVIQNHYKESERICEGLVTQVGEMLRQIEAMQIEGELASIKSRLPSLEASRDSLAEQLERPQAEPALLPEIRAELGKLLQRHSFLEEEDLR